MKLKLEIPEGYEVKGFDYPCVGDRILLPSGEAFKVDEHDQAYHCPGIILKEVWEPEVGAYYEFCDDANFWGSIVAVKKFYEINEIEPVDAFKYIDEDGNGWKYMRPFQGKLGK